MPKTRPTKTTYAERRAIALLRQVYDVLYAWDKDCNNPDVETIWEALREARTFLRNRGEDV